MLGIISFILFALFIFGLFSASGSIVNNDDSTAMGQLSLSVIILVIVLALVNVGLEKNEDNSKEQETYELITVTKTPN